VKIWQKNAMWLDLALAVSMTGMAMSADITGSGWRPSFMSASDLPAETHMLSISIRRVGQRHNGGCNQFFGAYSISGNTIKIGPLVSTRKGCPGLLHAETAFFATLEAAKSFAQEGDNLVLFHAAGAKLAQFVRAG
jgi:heat shock protein HslJ